MKFLRSVATILVALSIAVSPVFAMNREMKRSIQHQSMHEIVSTFVDENGEKHGALCTAYAVGPHTLLTAQHCDVHSNEVYVDPVSVQMIRNGEIQPYQIVDKEFDGEDHMLLDLKGANFKYTVEVKGYVKNGPRLPVQGERIYWWGNPGGMRDQFRQGDVMGSISWEPKDSPEGQTINGPTLWLIAAPVIGGDSGSAVFGEDGRIVGVVTFGMDEGQVMGMFAIQFSPEQILNSMK